MGRNKLLLPIGGLSVLRRAVSIAVDGGLDPVLVVLGHQSERRHRSDAVEVRWPSSRVTDLDSPEDFEHVSKSCRATCVPS